MSKSVIISDYDQMNKEINNASRIQKLNLAHFIGVTRVDKVIILQILITSMSDTIIYWDINSTNVLLEPSVDDSLKVKYLIMEQLTFDNKPRDISQET